jgi:hypothetical protein
MDLSHRWGGGSNILKTRMTTLQKMKSGISLSALPRTVQYAISFTQDLGIRYLWIDSLCVIQDDISDWERESSRMADIYANTYLNIAATSARTSSDGCFQPRWLKAVFNKSRDCPDYPVEDIKIHGTHRGLPLEVFARLEMGRAHNDSFPFARVGDLHRTSPLFTRAWVFQELYLAPRTIHFHCSELFWECKGSLRCECTELQNEIRNNPGLSRHRKTDMLSGADSYHKLYFWLAIMTEFCQLNLTHESDRLPALAGLASWFHDSTCGRYLGGLWGNDLVRMLLCSLNSSLATYERSDASAAPPSWSWASIVEYPDTTERGYNSPTYLLVQGYSACFKDDRNVELLNAECTVSEINPLGHVAAGRIIIRGTIIHSTLVRRRLETHVGFNQYSLEMNLDWYGCLQINTRGDWLSTEETLQTPDICIGVDLVLNKKKMTRYLLSPVIDSYPI